MTDQELLDKIKNTRFDDKEGFKEIINLVIDNLYVDATEFRNEISVGRATLKRWKFGHSSPHRLLAGHVFSWLAGKIQEQIDFKERSRGLHFFSTKCGPDD